MPVQSTLRKNIYSVNDVKIHYTACSECVNHYFLIRINEVPDKRGMDNRGCAAHIFVFIVVCCSYSYISNASALLHTSGVIEAMRS